MYKRKKYSERKEVKKKQKWRERFRRYEGLESWKEIKRCANPFLLDHHPLCSLHVLFIFSHFFFKFSCIFTCVLCVYICVWYRPVFVEYLFSFREFNLGRVTTAELATRVCKSSWICTERLWDQSKDLFCSFFGKKKIVLQIKEKCYIPLWVSLFFVSNRMVRV